MVETAYPYHIQIVFMGCAMLGGVMHYLKKYLKGETNVKLYQWYGKANSASTIYTVIVFIFTIIGALAADVVTSQTGFWAAMYSGFVTGFAIDAGFNSDANITKTVTGTRSDLYNLLGDQKALEEAAKAEAKGKTVETVIDGKKVIIKPKG